MFVNFGIIINVFLSLCTVNNGFILQAPNDMHTNNGDEDFKVELDMSEDDYEMVDEHNIDKLRIKYDDKFHGIERIASEEFKKLMESHHSHTYQDKSNQFKITQMENYYDNSVTISPSRSANQKIKREAAKKLGLQPDFVLKEYHTVSSEDFDFRPENIHLGARHGNHKSGYNILDSSKIISLIDMKLPNCTRENGFGIWALKCLFTDFKENRQFYKVLAFRLWSVAIIWLVMYLVVAISLWCAKGWCCCCLCCKFFKPQQTIVAAKTYLLTNPPGILITKRGGIIQYEPTEREKDCYEEFGHFIRTL